MSINHILAAQTDPDAILDHGARALLYSISQSKAVQSRIMQYVAMSGVSDHQKVMAIVSFLNQVAFPDSWREPKTSETSTHNASTGAGSGSGSSGNSSSNQQAFAGATAAMADFHSTRGSGA